MGQGWIRFKVTDPILFDEQFEVLPGQLHAFPVSVVCVGVFQFLQASLAEQ